MRVYGTEPLPGWRAEYYGNPWLAERPLAVSAVEAVAFDWGTAPPVPALPADGFAARYEADLSLPAGVHRFTLRARGGVRFWAGGRLLVDAWRDGAGETAREATVRLTAPETVRVRLEYADAGGRASVFLTRERDEAPPPSVWLPFAQGG